MRIWFFRVFDIDLRLIIKKQIKMKNGTVKFFNNVKGFGFIKEDGTNQEIFVHVSGLKEEIRQDDRVVFEVQEGKKGLNAVNVRLA
ncbi:MAG: cold-shock DNA-binding domain protein [Bacteroidetes bacterium]|nr:MAG: cold-shock DNA-binding domain protein [Bacteroidota bacterium]